MTPGSFRWDLLGMILVSCTGTFRSDTLFDIVKIISYETFKPRGISLLQILSTNDYFCRLFCSVKLSCYAT